MLNIKTKAFTLVELLVVISIIALLLSILMPSLSKAREQAKNVVDKSNLHSWGVSFALYAADNKDKVCAAVMMVNGQPDGWIRSLRKYFVNDKIRLCPSASRRLPDAIVPPTLTSDFCIGSQFGAWSNAGEIGSYGMNAYAQTSDALTQRIWGIDPKLCWGNFTVKNARSIPLVADCVWGDAYVASTDRPRPKEAITSSQQLDAYGHINRFLVNRHGKAINLVFLDSSVQNVNLSGLWQFSWSRVYMPPRDKITIKWSK